MSISQELQQRRHRALRLVLWSVLVGLVAGGAVVLYRYAIPALGGPMLDLVERARTGGPALFLLLALFVALAALSIFLTRREPLIGGSGLPHVLGRLHGELDYHPWRLALMKFLAGLAALTAGLTLGRQGPSVQIGALVADGLAERGGLARTDRRFLIAAGAAAGLATTVNAPLTGVVFALEVVHRSFSALALLSAMTAALIADTLAVAVFGSAPILTIPNLPLISLRVYWLLLLLGIAMGLSGVLYVRLILWMKKLYARLPLPSAMKLAIPFALTLLAILIDPRLFGVGEDFIVLPALGPGTYGMQIGTLLYIYALKLLLFALAFASGLPGGLFFPLLVLGSLFGHAAAIFFYGQAWLPAEWIVVLAVIAMSAHFTAIVRAPLTGALLMIEMTGSFRFMLPLGLVCLVAYLTAELCHCPPVIDALYGGLMADRAKAGAVAAGDKVGKAASAASAAEHMLIECPVALGSQADGALVRDLPWPESLLLVSVKRGREELIPRGPVRLQAGDILVVLLRENAQAEAEKVLAAMCKAPLLGK